MNSEPDLTRLTQGEDALGEFVRLLEAACSARGMRMSLAYLLYCLRDMPYRRPSSSSDVNSILREWRGTCSGKHLLVQKIFSALGWRAQLIMRAYPIDAADTLPPSLLQTFAGRGIWDVHNFVEFQVGTECRRIDITWPLALAEQGFTTTAYWDGSTDFRLAAPTGEDLVISADAHGLKLKKQLLQQKNDAASLSAREDFIIALAQYSDRLAPLVGMQDTIDGTLDRCQREGW
jgi:hypothetical protein